MKTLAISVIAWMCIFTSFGQAKTDRHISFSGKEGLDLKIQIADSINIETWNKNEVWVTASVSINNNADNDAYQVSFNDSGKTVEVNGNFKKDYFRGKDNCCMKSDIRWKIYIPEKAPLHVETIDGNTTIKGVTGEMKIKTISGFIDLSEPASKNAEIRFSTISGTVYTNHDFDVSRNSSIPEKFSRKMNKGGDLISLETISGNIFFRKAD